MKAKRKRIFTRVDVSHYIIHRTHSFTCSITHSKQRPKCHTGAYECAGDGEQVCAVSNQVHVNVKVAVIAVKCSPRRPCLKATL